MKSINNALGFASNDIARFRFRCIKILENQGYSGVKLAFPQVSRRSVFRWQNRYRKEGKQLTGLIPVSTRPHSLRQMVIPAQVLSFLKAMREQRHKLSKYKLKIFLDAFCGEKDLKLYSVSWSGVKKPAGLGQAGTVVNGYVERFNGIIQEEFIDCHVDVGIIDRPEFDRLLKNWLVYYNTQRPHHGLNLKTPLQYLQSYQPEENRQSAKCM